ncbi:MAG: tRNA lysidine(34) synthetase TilS [Eubacterium sp.]|nr:tRNA lysidine(34) synthetase TilS [Eubacterium sp.]
MLWNKLDQYVNRYGLLDETDRIIMGLSGGADSVCLARYLIRECGRRDISLEAVHINHMLRGSEADRDEHFVQDFCEKWKIPLHIFRRDIRRISQKDKISLEEAGRRERYACFRQVMGLGGVRSRLAVAHHADDQAETILFRMIRGTGPKGLAGMYPLKGDLIRPLLGLRKQEIRDILSALGQNYVEDSSNLDTVYARNYIRHQLVGKMEQINPQAVDHLCSLAAMQADLLRMAEAAVSSGFERTVHKVQNGILIDEKEICRLDPYCRQEVLRRALFMAAGQEKDITSVHIDQLKALLDRPAGRQMDFPYAIRAIRISGGILLCSAKDPGINPGSPGTSLLTFPGQNMKAGSCLLTDQDMYREIILPEYREGLSFSLYPAPGFELCFRYIGLPPEDFVKKDCAACFDYDKINCKICLRTRREGDYFVMDRQGRHKSLHRYYIDEKIPRQERDLRWLLACDSHVIWIPGRRISHSVRIGEDTVHALQAEIRAF